MTAMPAERPHKPRRRQRPDQQQTRTEAAPQRGGHAQRDAAPQRDRAAKPARRDNAPGRDRDHAPRRDRGPRPDNAPRREREPAPRSEAPDLEVVPPITLTGKETFASLGVPASLVTVLTESGIAAPFPIQATTLPDSLSGRDILGRGRTGSGKTLAFSIPLIAGLAGGRTRPGHPRGLVLVPTRELANQVHAVLVPLARAVNLSVVTIFGGTSQSFQVAGLRKGADIVVACPGRLADLVEQRHCHLDSVEISVIDEADHMADLGFLPVVRRLLDSTPSTGQRLLFSATLDNAVDVLVRRFLQNPAVHSVDSASTPTPKVVHHLFTISSEDRFSVLSTLASGTQRSLIFMKTKHGATKLARQLTEAQIPAVDLHGNLTQRARERNLASFTAGDTRVMIATDIAARGIHVDGVDLVVHADPPAEHKAYLHRSGRTARAGAHGVVVTLQTREQAHGVRSLMKRANVVPVATAVYPDSDILRALAGDPAPLVAPRATPNRESDTVQPRGPRKPRNDSAPGGGKPRFGASGAGTRSADRRGRRGR